MKYRSTEIVNAIQYTGHNEKEIEDWLHSIGFEDPISFEKEDLERIVVQIGKNNSHYLLKYDYLVDVDGWCEVMGPIYFESHYKLEEQYGTR